MERIYYFFALITSLQFAQMYIISINTRKYAWILYVALN